MERNNRYLSNAIFDSEKFKEIKEQTYFKDRKKDGFVKIFIAFLELAKVKSGSTEKNIFEVEKFKNFIDYFFIVIDDFASDENGDVEKLFVNKEVVIRLLKIQDDFLNDLSMYFHKLKTNPSDQIVDKRDKIMPLLQYMPFNVPLSSGENAMLNLFSRLYNFIIDNLVPPARTLDASNHYVFLIDEGDLGFHPKWKIQYVNLLVNSLPYFFDLMPGKPSFQIIITTHDPLTLSDILNYNVCYLQRGSYQDQTIVLDYSNLERPNRSFGANTTELLADSFFVDGMLIGEFAKEKIEETINWLNDEKDKSNHDYFHKVIMNIDEPIIQRKLAEMYDFKMETNVQLEAVNKQIEYLNQISEKLNKL